MRFSLCEQRIVRRQICGACNVGERLPALRIVQVVSPASQEIGSRQAGSSFCSHRAAFDDALGQRRQRSLGHGACDQRRLLVEQLTGRKASHNVDSGFIVTVEYVCQQRVRPLCNRSHMCIDVHLDDCAIPIKRLFDRRLRCLTSYVAGDTDLAQSVFPQPVLS